MSTVFFEDYMYSFARFVVNILDSKYSCFCCACLIAGFVVFNTCVWDHCGIIGNLIGSFLNQAAPAMRMLVTPPENTEQKMM